MNITDLSVVNACLASMGEAPINSLGENNEFINSAKFCLEQALLNEQSKPWWFNYESIEVLPSVLDEQYYVPIDGMDIDTQRAPEWLSLRDRRLYDVRNGRYLTGKDPIKVNIVRILPFEMLPLMARRLVKAAAVVMFQASYDGDKLDLAQREYEQAYFYLNAQHIRAVKANLLPNRGLGRGYRSHMRTHR